MFRYLRGSARDNLIETMDTPDFDMSTSHSDLLRVQIRHRVITYYIAKTEHTTKFFDSIGNIRCHDTKSSFNGGYRYEFWHDAWHSSKNDFNKDHYHTIFGNVEKITPNVLQCVIDHIEQYQYENNLCEATQNECLLSTTDKQKLITHYQEFYTKNLKKLEDSIYIKLVDYYHSAAKSLVDAFFSALLQMYIKPKLIDAGYSQSKIAWATDIIDSAKSYVLSGSLLNVSIAYGLKKGLAKALRTIGFRETVVETLTSSIATVVAITKNPFSLIEIGFNGGGVAFGKYLAMRVVICMLPKLKEEPPISAEIHDSNITGDEGHHSNLRRRNIG